MNDASPIISKFPTFIFIWGLLNSSNLSEKTIGLVEIQFYQKNPLNMGMVFHSAGCRKPRMLPAKTIPRIHPLKKVSISSCRFWARSGTKKLRELSIIGKTSNGGGKQVSHQELVNGNSFGYSKHQLKT